MISNWQIQHLFQQQLITVTGIPADIAFENVSFDPNSDAPFIRETILPGDELPSTNRRVRQNGLIQYDFLWPSGSGTKDVKIAADNAKHHFYPGFSLAEWLRVENASVTRGQTESPWYSQILRIGYSAFGTIQ